MLSLYYICFLIFLNLKIKGQSIKDYYSHRQLILSESTI
jgi:hypothetical protein